MLIILQVPSDKLTWARIFGTMEQATKDYDIDDYSVSQTTLEQVFINFARAQHAEREIDLTFSDKCALRCRQCRKSCGSSVCCCFRTKHS